MQVQHQDQANYVFEKVGAPFDSSNQHLGSLIFSQCILGHLFVRGYRMFMKDRDNGCCIMMKRINGVTEYLYLKFTQTASNKGVSKQELQQIQKSITFIDDWRKRQQEKYRVLICYLDLKSFSQWSKSQFLAFKQNKVIPSGLQNWSTSVISEEKEMCMGQEQISKIKNILWTYIDTFGGSKYKDSIYADLKRHNPTSFDIDKLINTVNWIIYCETAGKPYNQVETANWTCFQKQSKEKLSADRKDIVFTGSGHILMIHLILSMSIKSLQSYRKLHDSELDAVMLECRKSYSQREIKAYVISDNLGIHNLIYNCDPKSIRKQT